MLFSNTYTSVLRALSLILFTALLMHEVQGQTGYFLNGSANALGNGCYAITPADSWQNGSVWYNKKLSLLEPIDIQFRASFGGNDSLGADGMVLVLQTAGNNALGDNGEGMGFSGFNPALGIEFDVFSNWESNDPVFDHMAILSHGVVKHNRNENLAGPVPILASYGNVEDGKDHLIRFRWNPTSQVLDIFFDCERRLSLKKDLVKDVFQGMKEVYWGFTGATGKFYNQHLVCLDSLLEKNFYDTICSGDQIQLLAIDQTKKDYHWIESDDLVPLNSVEAIAKPTQSAIFQLRYIDVCGDTLKESFHIHVPSEHPQLMIDTFLCANDSLLITYEADSAIWYDNQRALQRCFYDSIQCDATIYRHGCAYESQLNIRRIDDPAFNWSGSSLCPGDSLTISPPLLLSNADTFRWTDGFPWANRTITGGDTFWLVLQNSCAEKSFPLKVQTYSTEPFELGSDTAICLGSSALIKPDIAPGGSLRWHDGSQLDTLVWSEAGVVSAELTDSNGCVQEDRMLISFIEDGKLPKFENMELCKGEERLLSIPLPHPEGRILINGENTINGYQLKNFQGPLKIFYQGICKADSAEILVRTIDCHCRFSFPNAFTPDQNGLNERFRPVIQCEWSLFHLTIYNRWGEKIYETSDPINGWDGQYKHEPAPSGIYLFVAEYQGKTNLGSETSRQSGLFHLMR